MRASGALGVRVLLRGPSALAPVTTDRPKSACHAAKRRQLLRRQLVPGEGPSAGDAFAALLPLDRANHGILEFRAGTVADGATPPCQAKSPDAVGDLSRLAAL